MADKKGMKKVEFEFPDPDAGVSDEVNPLEVEPAKNTTYNVLEDGDEAESSVEVKEDEKEKPVAKKDTSEVEVVDDTPEKDRNRTPSDPPKELTDAELKEHSEKVQNRLRHFSKGYHDQRRLAEAAERQRDEALRYAQTMLEENNKLKNTTSRSRNFVIAQAKKTAEAEVNAAEREYKEAYDSGEAEKVVEAQKKLTAAQVKLERANAVKPSPLPKQPLQPDQTAVQIPQQVPQPAPQQYAQPPQLDPATLKWQEENPWFGPDKEMTSFALGVHNKLAEEGVDVRSQKYWDRLNARMREVFPNEFGQGQDSNSNDSVVAPVTRSTAPRKYTLTKSQVAIAKRLNVPLEDYAKQVAMLDKASRRE